MNTHCKNGHEFTPENTYVPPKRPTVRICMECMRVSRRKVHKRRREFLKELRNGRA